MEFQNNNHKIDNMLDLDINKDILNLRDEKSTRNNLINIKEKLIEEINKILFLKEFPPYYKLNVEEHTCNKYIRNNSIEYMNDETIPLIGSKVSDLYINTKYKTYKTGIIIRESNEANVDVKIIEYEYNNEIFLYDLKQENISQHYKVNNDGSITMDKSHLKIINGCLPRNLEHQERRFIISKLPTERNVYSPDIIYYDLNGNETIRKKPSSESVPKYELPINVPRYYVLDKKLNVQYILNGVDIFELLKQHNEMIPYFKKYEDLNNERNYPSEKTKQLKEKLLILLKKKNTIEKLIEELPELIKMQGQIYSSSKRTKKIVDTILTVN